jgi:phosphopantetheinyl transferase (holo-ACP synthase)
MAGHLGANQGMGVDIERVRPLKDGFEKTAFTEEECNLLDSFESLERQVWVIRFLCAKEALGKALGGRAVREPKCSTVQYLNEHTGEVTMRLNGRLSEEFPELSKIPVVVHTAEEDNHVVASTICEKVGHV